ncbi:MAG: YceI family protein [Saprospirales bacterium]|nr:YceI family protein [Saprospirales bacterium]MBK8490982.1 YceI family protein [Saprospirales bacterium]
MSKSIFRTLFLALMLVPALSLFAGNGPIETYKVDLSASKLAWKGYKVTGEHFGVIQLKSGTIQFQDGRLTAGQFEVDMTSIEVQDMQGEYADKLKGHLLSDDFFGTTTYPTASLVMTKVTSLGNNEYDVTANLTIKGKTEPIQFKATIEQAGNKVMADAAVKIDRSKYDVRYGSASFFDSLGDKVIYDEFDLTISLVAGK